MSRFAFQLLTVLMCSVAVVSQASEQTAVSFDEVYAFLEQNAVNRTVSRDEKGTMAGGTVGYDLHREMTLCNLVRAKERFSYDVIYIIKQRNWDLKDGQQVGEQRVEDRILVQRFEFGARRSTGEIVGYSTGLTSTRDDWGGSTYLARLKLVDGALSVTLETGGYNDFFGPNDTRFPGASLTRQIWSVREGKLRIESRMTDFKVDPETGSREHLEDVPLTVEVETARLRR